MYTATSNVTFSNCIAHVTINRNRAKIYGNSIYLKDGQRFEIELYNPLSIRVLAKINLNGKAISNAGIVLKPGERVYLERFIDSNNKFIFETYEVESSKESLDAIQNNGSVEVSFYSESQPVIYTTNYIPVNPWAYTNFPTVCPQPGPWTLPNIYCSSIGTTDSTACTSSFYKDNTLGSDFKVTCDSFDMNSNEANKSMKSVETGMIGKGENSQQNLTQVFGDFNSSPFSVISYKLLPESQKPVEVSKLRQYCPNCRSRIRKETWKFCPSCGESL